LSERHSSPIAVGYWKSIESLAEQWKVEKVFEPKMPQAHVDELHSRWNEALKRSENWELHPEAAANAGTSAETNKES